MGQYSETIQFGSGLAAGGFTHTVNCTTLSVHKMAPDYFFRNGVFGYSVLKADAGGGAPRWDIAVRSNIAGVETDIAGTVGIGGLSKGFLPIQAIGTGLVGVTQYQFLGIPRPTSVVITGTSAGVGTSFGVVVTLTCTNER